MPRFTLKSLVLAPFSILALSVLLAGCGSSSADKGASLRAAWDMIPLAQAAQAGFPGAASTAVEASPAADGIADLQAGQCDPVILGRDPSPQEAQGLRDEVIGYDAVTIVIDQNSWKGGEWWVGDMPSRRTSGLRALTTADIKGLFSFWTAQAGERWKWPGAATDPNNRWLEAWKAHYDETGQSVGQGWISDDVAPIPFVFPQGKYDTQTALYQILGLDEKAITDVAAARGLTAMNADTEEQVLGSQYSTQASGDFTFKVGFASWRTAKLALQRLSVSIVSIDGIDPIANPQSVYDGTYPLSRRIHLLTGENCVDTDGLAQFLLSPEGQQVVQDAGYLPLPPKS